MTSTVIDTYNAITGAIVAILSYILGEHWILFAAFLLLNVADWVMIAVAFGAAAVFIEIGTVIGVDLSITTLLGWFVLASLLVNEIRSIVENFAEAGFHVPNVLIKGLEVADKAINKENQEGE